MARNDLRLQIQKRAPKSNRDNVPPKDDDGHVKFQISVFLESIGTINERDNAVAVAAAVWLQWTIPDSLYTPPSDDFVFAVSKAQDNMWTPKVVPVNCLNLDGMFKEKSSFL